MSVNQYPDQPNYFWTWRWWLLAATATSALDAITTMQFMLAFGHEAELHPIIRLVSGWCGPFFGPVIGKLGQLTALVGLTWWQPRWGRVLYSLMIVLGMVGAVINIAQADRTAQQSIAPDFL